MTEEGSGKGFGLFGKKGMKPSDVTLCIISKYDREEFFQSLINYGWDEVEEAFEFERKWPEKRLRKAAKEHAAEIAADLLVEVRDNDYSTNPFNDYVYYTWRSGPNTRGLPPQPSQTSQRAMSQQMQMLADQQRALIQQQQMLQRMQMQVPQGQPQQQMPMQPQPGAAPGAPQGQVCARCGGNQIQYMANGMAKCIRCGFMFQWKQTGQQQVQQPQMQQQTQPQPQSQPTQAPAPKSTQTPAPAQQKGQAQSQGQGQAQGQPQAQMPQVKPPVQPGTPAPPGSKPCPKCGNPLNIFPDGSSLCNKCGYTGQ